MTCNCFAIFDENWVNGYYANYTVSSEATLFPKENLIDRDRRTKYWRSQGYWKIVSGDNTIVFQETTSVNLTATITAGEYQTAATFLAAIKTALEAAGDSTYTVSQNSTTKKITIASNGGGGGGIFSLIWTHADSADMAGILGFDTATDQTGALTYTADVLKLHTSEWVTFDLGMASNPQAFALIYNRNKPIPLSPNATITLKGNETNAWSSPSFSQSIEYNSECLSYIDLDGFHTDELRYWRLEIVDTDNVNGYLEAGYIFLGHVVQLAQGAPQFPLQKSHIDFSRQVTAEGGQILVDQRPQGSRYAVNWAFLTKEDKEDMEFLFQEYGTHTPFFVSMDSDEAFSTAFQKSVKYVRFQAEPVFVLDRPNIFSVRFDLLEAL